MSTNLANKIIIDKNQLLFIDKISDCEIVIKQNVELTLVAMLQKGWEKVQKLNFRFEGENSTVNFFAIVIGQREETFPFETISTHLVPHTNAYYYVRSALFDKSKIDYKGSLIIKKPAQLTDSYLAHHSLMLSKDARTDSTPCLEIEADDVKAGHAATIGNVDDETIFYFESRGIDRKNAQELLIKSFLKSDLEKIPDETIRRKIESEIEKIN